MPIVSPKDKMIRTAAKLFQQGGYAATSWRKLVQQSGAPWGSAQHYFPGGKEQLGVAAIELAAQSVAAFIQQCFSAEGTAVEGVNKLFTASAARLAKSSFREGCPLTTAALETVPVSAMMSTACAAAFELWIDALSNGLMRTGIAAKRARNLATMILSAYEGGLVSARVMQSVEPLRTSAAMIAEILEKDVSSAKRR